MNDQPMIIRNWLLLAVSNSVRILFHFLCTVQIARLLVSEDYGRYTLVLTTVLIAQPFASLALRNISIREISRVSEALPVVARAIAKAVSLATVVTAMMIVVIFVLQPDHKMLSLLLFILLLVIADSIWGVMETLAFSQNKMQVSAILFIASSLTWLLIVFAIPAQMFSLTTIVGSYAIVQFTSSLIYLWSLLRSGDFFPRILATDYSITGGQLVRQSLPLLGSALLALPLSQLPVVFLANHSGLEEVAYYGIGARLAQPLLVLSGTLLSAIYPSLSAYFVSQQDFFRTQSRALFLALGGVGIALGVLVSALANEIVVLLYGSRYLPAVVVVSIQVWVVLNWIMHNLVGSLFVISNREKTVVILSSVNAALIGTAAFVGAHFGAIGLSLTLWVGGLVGFAIHWMVLKKSLPEVFSASVEIRVFLPYLGFSTLSVFLPSFSLQFRIIVLVGACTLLVWLFRRGIADSIQFTRTSLNRQLTGAHGPRDES